MANSCNSSVIFQVCSEGGGAIEEMSKVSASNLLDQSTGDEFHTCLSAGPPAQQLERSDMRNDTSYISMDHTLDERRMVDNAILNGTFGPPTLTASMMSSRPSHRALPAVVDVDDGSSHGEQNTVDECQAASTHNVTEPEQVQQSGDFVPRCEVGGTAHPASNSMASDSRSPEEGAAPPLVVLTAVSHSAADDRLVDDKKGGVSFFCGRKSKGGFFRRLKKFFGRGKRKENSTSASPNVLRGTGATSDGGVPSSQIQRDMANNDHLKEQPEMNTDGKQEGCLDSAGTHCNKADFPSELIEDERLVHDCSGAHNEANGLLSIEKLDNSNMSVNDEGPNGQSVKEREDESVCGVQLDDLGPLNREDGGSTVVSSKTDREPNSTTQTQSSQYLLKGLRVVPTSFKVDEEDPLSEYLFPSGNGVCDVARCVSALAAYDAHSQGSGSGDDSCYNEGTSPCGDEQSCSTSRNLLDGAAESSSDESSIGARIRARNVASIRGLGDARQYFSGTESCGRAQRCTGLGPFGGSVGTAWSQVSIRSCSSAAYPEAYAQHGDKKGGRVIRGKRTTYEEIMLYSRTRGAKRAVRGFKRKNNRRLGGASGRGWDADGSCVDTLDDVPSITAGDASRNRGGGGACPQPSSLAHGSYAQLAIKRREFIEKTIECRGRNRKSHGGAIDHFWHTTGHGACRGISSTGGMFVDKHSALQAMRVVRGHGPLGLPTRTFGPRQVRLVVRLLDGKCASPSPSVWRFPWNAFKKYFYDADVSLACIQDQSPLNGRDASVEEHKSEATPETSHLAAPLRPSCTACKLKNEDMLLHMFLCTGCDSQSVVRGSRDVLYEAPVPLSNNV
ncbi:hypothetical protein ERJ75_000417500 [Trypanosoma vivax]|uniref:Uncharacterized protein n=1 Tax=Trypanosoma vivax (strain Y486) TaxID=1055687 RepID=G0TZH1_TRYVY|nr:hypothetical protein ERJ75_000417500 [Trypanosoma vivax]CCC49375.1 conserved hypothetical protein [Trypanosoma vivax Y486]